MKRTAIHSLTLILILVLAGCGTRERPSKPSATGKAGEMLVVAEKVHWDGQAGDIIRRVFQQPEPMFLQSEPMFDLVFIEKANFGKLFESHRHIFIFELDPSLARATIEVSRDVFSYPQMLIRVKSPDLETFSRLMDANAGDFTAHYLEVERIRLINAYERMANHAARAAVQQKFGVNIVVPEGYFVAVEGDDFLWLRRTGTRDDLEMGVLISTMRYTDPTATFLPANIRARRDSITRRYIPGQFDGSYMTTYPELEPAIREIDFNGRFAIEMRSLWRLEGDFMGGPFVNYTLVDENTNRVFILDGFVYAPKFDKRDYLRQLQAVIYSIDLTPVQGE